MRRTPARRRRTPALTALRRLGRRDRRGPSMQSVRADARRRGAASFEWGGEIFRRHPSGGYAASGYTPKFARLARARSAERRRR